MEVEQQVQCVWSACGEDLHFIGIDVTQFFEIGRLL